MRVLMISLDRGLLGEGRSGDVVERHRRYADLAGHLDVIVFAGAEYERQNWASNLTVIPTRSKRSKHYQNAVQIAMELGNHNKYDLLITQDLAAPAGAKIKRELRLPWLVNVHSMFFTREWLKLNPLNWYLFYLVKKAIKTADAFRVNNFAIKEQILKWVPDKPVLVQPTPVDLEKFKVESSKFKVLDQNSGLRIFYVGRLSPEKNVGMLIRAFQSVIASPPRADEAISLEIVGAGPEEPKLRALAQEDQRIQFLGAKSANELVSIYQRADVFVLPSNTESFGQVLLQAAAAGCAIITTKTPGALSIFGQSEAAVLIDIGDQDALVAALQNLYGDAALRQKLGDKAQAVAAGFDGEKGISNTVNFWKEIASSPVRLRRTGASQ